MLFLVYGRDGDEFGSESSGRDEAHQAYMDGWLPRMIGRGPTLSPDGEDHTGSVHVIDADDLAVARAFAADEPYASAGWYAEVSVWPMRPVLDGTMWDRPRPAGDQVSSFVLATWSARPIDEVHIEPADWLFAGELLSDDLRSSVGFAAAIDLPPEEVLQSFSDCPGAIEVHCWERGGRRP
ncbi:MAG TPA: YciI family protein [Pseudonocardiaceae bacterium]|jgi:hypothetical protein